MKCSLAAGQNSAQGFLGDRGFQQNSELDNYLVCDLGFSKTLTLGGLDYDLKLSMNNVTGEDDEKVAGYPMPGHVWGMSLGVRF